MPDLFGVAVDAKGRVFFSDGTGDNVRRINPDGSLKTIAADLDTPSGLAFERGGWFGDGSLIVANTGGHTIVRIDIGTARSNLVAGAPGQSGFADGDADHARFNGAVGVAVNKDGVIFVADTYNDRIRAVEGGRVRTIAGGDEPGFRDGRGAEARFDTPCGIAVGADGALLVADTGNHRIRRVTPDGEVTTIAGTGEPEDRDGNLAEAAFCEPTGIAARRDGMIFVTCACSSSVRMIDLKGQVVTTVAGGGFPGGLVDGAVAKAKLNRPSSLAFASNDALVFADANNGLIRAVVPEGASFGFQSDPGAREDQSLRHPRRRRAALALRPAGGEARHRGHVRRNPRRDAARSRRVVSQRAGHSRGLRRDGARDLLRTRHTADRGRRRGRRARTIAIAAHRLHPSASGPRSKRPARRRFPERRVSLFAATNRGGSIGVRVRRGTRINAGDRDRRAQRPTSRPFDSGALRRGEQPARGAAVPRLDRHRRADDRKRGDH